MTQIKICGLTRKEDIAAVNRWLPDYIGFVFAASRRQVTPKQADMLKSGLDHRIKAVGVFVNETVQSIVSLYKAGIIDAVQLHGDEDADFIASLQTLLNTDVAQKERPACPVIKAVRVQSTQKILQAQDLPCHLLLLDTFQKGEYGGSGEVFDHSLIPPLAKPFFLAGGLDCCNIANVVRKYRPFGVDVSSGVETNGIKDEAKIRLLIETVRTLYS